jgi:hypothetical protein
MFEYLRFVVRYDPGITGPVEGPSITYDCDPFVATVYVVICPILLTSIHSYCCPLVRLKDWSMQLCL